MTDDLVKRQRAGTGDGLRAWDWMNEAADRIEALERERDALKIARGTALRLGVEQARREALEEAARIGLSKRGIRRDRSNLQEGGLSVKIETNVPPTDTGKNDPREILIDAERLVDQLLKTEPLRDVAMTMAAALAICAERMGGTQQQQVMFAKLMAEAVKATLGVRNAARS